MYATINIYDKGDNLIFKYYCGIDGYANVMVEEPFGDRYIGFNFNLYSSGNLDESLVPDKLKPIDTERPLRKLDREML